MNTKKYSSPVFTAYFPYLTNDDMNTTENTIYASSLFVMRDSGIYSLNEKAVVVSADYKTCI